MIWARRTFAILLVPFFLAFFLVILLVLRVNSTVLNAQFLLKQLRKNDVYASAYALGEQAALIELRQEQQQEQAKLAKQGQGKDEGGGSASLLAEVDLEPVVRDVFKAARQSFPPDWLQSETESAVLQVYPYILGDSDEFTVTLHVNDRIAPTGAALKELVHGQGFASAYDAAVVEAAKEAKKKLDEWQTFKIDATQEDIEGYIRTVAPREWIVARVDSAVDAAVPYLDGGSDHFTVTVPVADRVEAVSQVVKDLAGKSDVSKALFDDILLPRVTDQVGTAVPLPFGASVSPQEVITEIKKAVPNEWITARAAEAIDATVAYMTGKSDTVSIRVPIADRKDAAFASLAGLVDRKLEGVFNSVRACGALEIPTLTSMDQLPSCRPAGLTYADVKALLGIDPRAIIDLGLTNAVPGEITVTDAEVRGMVGKDMWDTVEKARGYVTKGVSLTVADTASGRKLVVGPDLATLDLDAEALDTALDVTRNGVTFTSDDLRDGLSDKQTDNEALKMFDKARKALHTARTYLWLLPLIPLLLLAGIGFLGGRNWGSRLAWAAAPLVFASLLLVVVAGPVYTSFARPKIQDQIQQSIDDSNETLLEGATAEDLASVQADIEVKKLFMDKGMAIGWSFTDDFLGGLRNQGIALLVVGVGALAGGIVLQARRGRGGAPAPTAAPPATA